MNKYSKIILRYKTQIITVIDAFISLSEYKFRYQAIISIKSSNASLATATKEIDNTNLLCQSTLHLANF